jgi:ABC-type polysaccharide/polyol phosphate export permease
MTEQTSALLASRELFWNLTLRELRGKYKRSALGWAWSMLNPLSTMVIFTVVFLYIFKATPPTGDPSGLKNFPLYLLCGLLPWNFFNGAVSGAMGSLLAASGLIRKVWFPREVIVFAATASLAVSMAIEMGLVVVGLLVAGNVVFAWIPVVLVVLVLLGLFATGLGLALSAANVYFRDLSYLWSILAQVWFYATPIVYSLDQIPERMRAWVQLNPMTLYVESIRSCLYDLAWPAWYQWLGMLGLSSASLALGLVVFARLSPRFAEEL